MTDVVHVGQMPRPDSELIEERTSLGVLARPDHEGDETRRLETESSNRPEATIPPPLPSQRSHLILVSAQATEDVIAQRPVGTGPPRTRSPSASNLRRPRFGPRTLAGYGADAAADVASPTPRRDLTAPKALLPGLALPPPTEFDVQGIEGVLANDESSYHHLRRDDSVIAAAIAARSSPMARAKTFWERASSSIKENTAGVASVLGEGGLEALRRFERLPRRQQLLWVAAPYVGAAFLVLVLFQVRGAEAEALAPPPAVPVLAAPKAAPAVALPVAANKMEPELVAPPKTRALQTKSFVLLDKAILLGRPDVDGPQVVKLRPGSRLTLYPDFPSPKGWVMVQSEKGTIGFLNRADLERGPSDSPPAKPKKRARRR